MMYSYRPCRVHKFWGFYYPDEPRMKQTMNTCPEMLCILPLHVVDGDRAWQKVVCSLDITCNVIEIATSSGTFDYVTYCPLEKNADVVNGTNI